MRLIGLVVLEELTVRGDDHSGGKKPLGYLERDIEEATQVAAQIKDKDLHARRVQFGNGRVEFLGGCLLEADDLHVADPETFIDEAGLRNARDADDLAL